MSETRLYPDEDATLCGRIGCLLPEAQHHSESHSFVIRVKLEETVGHALDRLLEAHGIERESSKVLAWCAACHVPSKALATSWVSGIQRVLLSMVYSQGKPA